MKKAIFVIGLCIASVMGMRAQVVQENELALVYYMPQTLMDIDITYIVETEEAGPYSRYAEKYLGTEDVVSVNSQQAEIVSVRVRPRSKADLNRPFKVGAEDGVNMQLLSIQDNGVLYGYNTGVREGAPSPADDVQPADTPRPFKATQGKEKAKQPAVLPLMEEQLKAQSPAQRAEAVAKQIYRIREARMYLLSGEIENAPGDGKGLEVALKELSRQEKELVQLFTGKRSRKTMVKTIQYMPTKSEEKPLLYFSLENGVTAEEDASALPIMLNFIARKQVLAPSSPTKKKDKAAPVASALYYNLPGAGIYTITYDGATLLEGTLPVAQFGIAVPLAKSLFTGGKLPKIYFDTETGNIQAICNE
ncbi:MAG: DUF4831 family protein [Paludibacteraceae bacterium]